MKNARLALAGLAAAMLFSAQALADATVVSLKGDARIGNAPISQGQRIYSGTTVSTSQDAQLVLKFEDDQQVVLDQNTTFRIADFRYRAAEPRGDRGVFDLMRGALRFITGVVGARNPATIQVRFPQATIGIRGTDFMVAVVNPAYLNVLQGSVAATNSAGTVVFGPGGLAQIASPAALAAPIPATALPAGVSGAFSNLAAAQVAAAVTPAAAQAATGAATGTAAAAAPAAGVGAAVTIGAGAAIIGIAVDGSSTSTTTHH